MNAAPAHPPSRREMQRQSRREAILQVAARSFRDKGYDATTMSDIATTLGGSKGTLWSYFPSKETLFVAVLDHLTEDFRGRLSLILNPHHDLETALRNFCREFVIRITDPEGIALYRLVVAESPRFPEIGAIFEDCGPRLTREVLTAFLADAIARGKLRSVDPAIPARQLVGLCLSGSRQRVLLGLTDRVTAAEVNEDVDQAVDIFLRAYAVH